MNTIADRLYKSLKEKYPDEWIIRGVAVEKDHLTVLVDGEPELPEKFEGIAVEGAMVGAMSVPYYNQFYIATDAQRSD